jgi:hypothetical protein
MFLEFRNRSKITLTPLQRWNMYRKVVSFISHCLLILFSRFVWNSFFLSPRGCHFCTRGAAVTSDPIVVSHTCWAFESIWEWGECENVKPKWQHKIFVIRSLTPSRLLSLFAYCIGYRLKDREIVAWFPAGIIILPIPVAAQSKAWVCGRSLFGIAGSNHSGASMPVSCDCCVLSGAGLRLGLIPCPEESYRVWCVWVWSQNLNSEEALAH